MKKKLTMTRAAEKKRMRGGFKDSEYPPGKTCVYCGRPACECFIKRGEPRWVCEKHIERETMKKLTFKAVELPEGERMPVEPSIPPGCPFNREKCQTDCIGFLELDDFTGCFTMAGFKALEEVGAAIGRSKYRNTITKLARGLDLTLKGDMEAAKESFTNAFEDLAVISTLNKMEKDD